MKILILTVLTTYTLGNIPVAHSTIPGGTIQIPDISYLEYKSTTSGRVPTIAIGDGVISDLWNNITEYPNPSYGTGGSIKAAYGQSSIYFLLTVSDDNLWAAMQWDSDNTGSSAIPMQQNDDMWVFGATEFTSVNGDGYSAGQGTDPYVYQDAQNDVQWEAIPEPGFVQYEVVRKLQTGDTAGHDIQFEPTQTYHLFTASTNHHGIDNEITDYQFELTTIKLGEAPLTNQNVVPTVDMPVFLIKYLNSALAFGIGLLFVVLLPAVLLSRRSFV